MNPIEAIGVGLNYTGTVNHHVIKDQISPKSSPAAQGTPDAA